MGDITVNTSDTSKYVDYSSCFKEVKKKKGGVVVKTSVFSDKAFGKALNSKVKDDKNITVTELTSLFTGLTEAQASQLIDNADKADKKSWIWVS